MRYVGALLIVVAMAAIAADDSLIRKGPAPPLGADGKLPWVFSPSGAADPNGPTPVCLRDNQAKDVAYKCYGGEAINAVIRAQSRDYLEREAAKLAPGAVMPPTKAPHGKGTAT